MMREEFHVYFAHQSLTCMVFAPPIAVRADLTFVLLRFSSDDGYGNGMGIMPAL